MGGGGNGGGGGGGRGVAVSIVRGVETGLFGGTVEKRRQAWELTVAASDVDNRDGLEDHLLLLAFARHCSHFVILSLTAKRKYVLERERVSEGEGESTWIGIKGCMWGLKWINEM